MPTTAYTADELRNCLVLAFQPSITSRPGLLNNVIIDMAEQFTEAGVTERRIRNAADAVHLDGEYLDRILVTMNVIAAMDARQP